MNNKLKALVLVFSSVMLINTSASAAINTPFGDLPSSQTTVSSKTSTGGISIQTNDTKAYRASSEVDGWKTNDAWIGNDTYAGDATSKCRTQDTGEIRDIDSIYARVRCYINYGSGWTLDDQASETATNAADAKASISSISCGDDDIIFYGSHSYKEAGYVDIYHELEDSTY